MNSSSAIRLLASANNERGDLFTRLTKDLFFALGYDDLRLNVHKSGRELDLQGKHRFEPRRIVGECKAHTAKMGGDELNKFFGVLNRERSKSGGSSVAGYFVSLSGFTETGVDQELDTGDNRVILLDAEKVVQELENCRVIVARTSALERAGRCAEHAKLGAVSLDGAELLGHKRGYVWAVFYAHGKERTHLALIHADGTPLAKAVAMEVIDADRLCGGSLHALNYLAPPAPAPDRGALAANTAASYRHWLAEEFGYIQLDGLPADTDLSATRLKLERLFVPLKVNFLPHASDLPAADPALKNKTVPIGVVLSEVPHLALLAMPGGGKSTLLKRLAMAYAFPERRDEVSDDLPRREWLPIILRCRELRDRAHRPIIELLDDIPLHVGMNPDECAMFRETAHAALRAGNALLLVDGLDEISDEGARQTFANHLRTFLAMFPQVALVVTSREAGFRLVAGVVASACEQARLAPLDEGDVLALCERWHVEVVGDTPKVRTEAKDLARMIWGDRRIRSLAENPLLLTTLLVVKRCLRELPRSRTALYREAIRVLVRTWNVEGYAPLDEDEALAQLSYVACAMMHEGKQQIGQKALLKLLQSARRELDAELQFARISPQEFIDRIEYRSSLLMQTGYERLNGVLEPVFEFRHLTFQEYLAARGYFEEQYPGRNEGRGLTDELERHFTDERWWEVIALAAVLAGRKAEELVKRLIVVSKPTGGARPGDRQRGVASAKAKAALSLCIRDEVQVTGPTLRIALLLMSSGRGDEEVEPGWILTTLQGKFGAIFQEVVAEAYLKGGPEFDDYGSTLARVSTFLRFGDREPEMSDAVAASLLSDLATGDRLDRIRAALVCMLLAFELGRPNGQRLDSASKGLLSARFQPISVELTRMIFSDDLPSAWAASWATAWLGENRLLLEPPQPELLLSLFSRWRQLLPGSQARMFSWALEAQRLLARDTFPSEAWGDCDEFLRRISTDEKYQMTGNRGGALVVGWYRRSPWNDAELVKEIFKIGEPSSPFGVDPTVRELLENLGDAGQEVLRKWERKWSKTGSPQSNRKTKKSQNSA
jgi:hypothetical protein